MQRRESNQRSIRTSSWCSQLNTLNDKRAGHHMMPRPLTFALVCAWLLGRSLGGLLGSLLGGSSLGLCGKLGSTLGLLGLPCLGSGLLGSGSLGCLLRTGSLRGSGSGELSSCGTTKLVGKALDASTGVDELLGASVERMALVAQVKPHAGNRGVSGPRVAARATNRALHVIGMDALLHGYLLT